MRFCKNRYSEEHLSIQRKSTSKVTVAINFFGREPSLRTVSFDTSTTHAHLTHTFIRNFISRKSTSQKKPRGSSSYLVRTARCVKSLHMYIHIYVYVCIITDMSHRCCLSLCHDRLLSTRISCRPVYPDIPRSLCALARAPPSLLIAAEVAVVS